MRLSPSDPAAALRRAQSAFLLDLRTPGVRTEEERRAAFREPLRGTVEERWHVYAHGYLARLSDAIGQELPAVRRVLGGTAFDALISRYAAACPPRSYDLAHAAGRMPEFLVDDPLTEDLPFLPDLARLERAVSEAFVAEDAEPLTWTALQALSPEEVASLPIASLPGTALVASPWPLLELWRARELADEDVSIELAPDASGTVGVAVHRRGERVLCEPLTQAEACLLDAALRAEAPLAVLVARAGRPPADSLLAFKSLVERGLFQQARNPRAETGHI